MQARCELCKYYRQLKHNFRRGIGWELSHVCVLYVDDADSFLLEVSPNEMCEVFTERETVGHSRER